MCLDAVLLPAHIEDVFTLFTEANSVAECFVVSGALEGLVSTTLYMWLQLFTFVPLLIYFFYKIVVERSSELLVWKHNANFSDVDGRKVSANINLEKAF